MEKQSKTKPKTKFDAFFDNRALRILFGVLCLVVAYAFGSWAIDSGSLLDYAITALLIFIGLRELIGGIRGLSKPHSGRKV